MSDSILNFDNIQMEGARRKIDPIMRGLSDQLDDAYYNFWKNGQSQAFFLWDYVQGEDNKKKFEILGGIIHHLTFLAQHLFNTDEQTPYPESSYNTGNPTKVSKTKQAMASLISQYNSAGLTPTLTPPRINNIVDWIKSRPVVSELRSRRQTDTDRILDPLTDGGD